MQDRQVYILNSSRNTNKILSTNLMKSQGSRVIIDLALMRCRLDLDWIIRSGGKKGEVAAMTTFHRHCVHHPLEWKPNL